MQLEHHFNRFTHKSVKWRVDKLVIIQSIVDKTSWLGSSINFKGSVQSCLVFIEQTVTVHTVLFTLSPNVSSGTKDQTYLNLWLDILISRAIRTNTWKFAELTYIWEQWNSKKERTDTNFQTRDFGSQRNQWTIFIRLISHIFLTN